MPDSTQQSFFLRHRLGLGVLAISAIALLILILAFDWNWLRGPAERIASQKSGRQIKIGHLDVSFGSSWREWAKPVIVLDDLRLGNVTWAVEPTMATARRVAVQVSLSDLWHKRVVVPFLTVDRPDALLERRADGRNNWVFSATGNPDSPAPLIQHLQIHQGRIRYQDAPLDAKVEILADTIATPAAGKPVSAYGTHFVFQGNFKQAAFKGTAQTGNVLSLRESTTPFALQTDVKLAQTRVRAQGTVTNLLKPSAVDMHLEINGPSLAQLYPFLYLPLPESPPYHAAGQLQIQGDHYAYRNFTGTIGKSDISGDAQYLMRRPRPKLSATLSSRTLDLNDLGPLIGLKPASQNTDSKSTINTDAKTLNSTSESFSVGKVAVNNRNPSKPKNKEARVLPQTPISLEKINLIDADVTLRAKKLKAPAALAFEDFYASLKLDNGKLQLNPLQFGFAGGRVHSDLQMDAHTNPILTQLNAQLQHIELKRAFPTIKLMQSSEGRIGGNIQLKSKGNSVAAMLGNADGKLSIGLNGGEISNLIVELMGLDAGEALKFWLGGDHTTRIRCGGAAFVVNQGKGVSQRILLDTVDTRIDGAGSFDLKDEKFDITLRPQPKDKSILVLRTPLHLHGSFTDPHVSLDKKGLIARGGGALLLGLINPMAALIPLIETGGGKDGVCTDVLSTKASTQ